MYLCVVLSNKFKNLVNGADTTGMTSLMRKVHVHLDDAAAATNSRIFGI